MATSSFTQISWQTSALIFLALALMSGIFSGIEASIFALGRPGRLRRKSETARNHRFRLLLQNSERTLTTLQLADIIVNLGAILFAADAAVRFWPGNGGYVMWAGMLLGGAALLVLGEAAPRGAAARWPDFFVRRGTPFLEVALILLAPFRWPIQKISARLAPAGMTRGQLDRSIQEEEEFRAFLSATEVTGLLEEDEREMIDSIFEFAETTAGEIMTPRTDIEGYLESLPQAEMLEALRQTPHSRVVIYEETFDHISGIILAKDVLLDPQTEWRELIRPAPFVPAAMELDELLAEFKRKKSHLAIVVDEYGGTAGLVTLHDLVQEIIGEIPEEDEELEKDLEAIEPGVSLAAGWMETAQCNELLETHFPAEKAHTLAGLMFVHLGRVPEVGEEMTIGRARLRVMELEETRIERIELRLLDGGGASEASGPAEHGREKDRGGKDRTEDDSRLHSEPRQTREARAL